jgi:SAM-dependent methyltransferase
MLVDRLKSWVSHPLTRGLDLDDPRTTRLRRRIIQEKPALKQIYQEWYQSVVNSLPRGEDPVLEVGSGGGFFRSYLPDLITSEIFQTEDVQVVLDATRLPFGDGSLRAIVLIDVLHHIAQPRQFIAQAAQCVRKNGTLVMIEPWVSTWSSLIYRRFHHEPFRPESEEWEFPPAGPLSGANGALPWIMFLRDRDRFEREFPCWEIKGIRPILPFRYLASGGVSLRNLLPAAAFDLLRRLEHCLQPWIDSWAMFAEIVLVKNEEGLRNKRK